MQQLLKANRFEGFNCINFISCREWSLNSIVNGRLSNLRTNLIIIKKYKYFRKLLNHSLQISFLDYVGTFI